MILIVRTPNEGAPEFLEAAKWDTAVGLCKPLVAIMDAAQLCSLTANNGPVRGPTILNVDGSSCYEAAFTGTTQRFWGYSMTVCLCMTSAGFQTQPSPQQRCCARSQRFCASYKGSDWHRG